MEKSYLLAISEWDTKGQDPIWWAVKLCILWCIRTKAEKSDPKQSPKHYYLVNIPHKWQPKRSWRQSWFLPHQPPEKCRLSFVEDHFANINNMSKTDVAPWCNGWDWMDGVKYRAPCCANNGNIYTWWRHRAGGSLGWSTETPSLESNNDLVRGDFGHCLDQQGV